MSIPYVFNRTGETYQIPEWRLDRNDSHEPSWGGVGSKKKELIQL